MMPAGRTRRPRRNSMSWAWAGSLSRTRRVRFLMDGEALYAGIEAATTPGKLLRARAWP